MQFINEEEKALRAQIIKEANFSVDIEGFVISPALQLDFDRYIAGEISLDEVIRLTQERFK